MAVVPSPSDALLAGKVIVVTGGAGLLGRAFCRTIVEHGGTAVVADIDEARAREAAAEVGAEFPSERTVAVGLDINDLGTIGRLIETVQQQFGRIDGLVNNAYPRNPRYGRKFEDVTHEDFCENVSMHLGGYFLVVQQFVKFFRGQGHGNIVNLASVYGTIAPRFEIYRGTTMTMPVEYAVIKAGILQLTKYLSRYVRGESIRVNAISPGGVADGQPEPFLEAYRAFCANKGMLDAADVCGALLFLLSDLSHFVNGQNLVVDDGFSL